MWRRPLHHASSWALIIVTLISNPTSNNIVTTSPTVDPDTRDGFIGYRGVHHDGTAGKKGVADSSSFVKGAPSVRLSRRAPTLQTTLPLILYKRVWPDLDETIRMMDDLDQRLAHNQVVGRPKRHVDVPGKATGNSVDPEILFQEICSAQQYESTLASRRRRNAASAHGTEAEILIQRFRKILERMKEIANSEIERSARTLKRRLERVDAKAKHKKRAGTQIDLGAEVLKARLDSFVEKVCRFLQSPVHHHHYHEHHDHLPI